jgi:hypothetical protein
MKVTLKNNLSTVQPIFANSIPIDSSRQVEEEKPEKSQNYILQEQPGAFETMYPYQ